MPVLDMSSRARTAVRNASGSVTAPVRDTASTSSSRAASLEISSSNMRTQVSLTSAPKTLILYSKPRKKFAERRDRRVSDRCPGTAG